jgi:hypothetical protein
MSRKQRYVMAKRKFQVVRRKTDKRQKRAGNAMTHGAYSDISAQNLDGRSKLVKTLRHISSYLTRELGGEPTTQETLIIERASFKAVKCILAEIAMLSNSRKSSGLESQYLAWSNSLRLDLQALGLERRMKTVQSLHEYITQKESNDE